MDDLRKDIIQRLKNAGYIAEEDGCDVAVVVSINGMQLRVICKLGEHFPYELPQVFLSEETWKTLPAMPHKNTDGSICTFDKSVVIPNFNYPCELVLAVVKKAEEILIAGINHKNTADYYDEFLAYWDTREQECAQLFVENMSSVQLLYWVKNESRSVISDSLERALEINAAALGKEIDESIKGILIPIKADASMAIPKNDVQFIKLIEKHTEFKKNFNKFMQDSILLKRFFVVASESTDQGNKLFGWLFYGPGVPNGFRKGHVNLSIAFGKSSKQGKPLALDDCSQKRLYYRGGDGNVTSVSDVCIIGCGSIGSLVAEAMLASGTTKYTLVDKEILTYENIARHYAGFFWVGKSKVSAIKTNLELHNPNVVCETFFENAFKFIDEKPDIINKSDLVVVAVAYAPLEHYIFRMISEEKISAPVLFVWVEPYAIAGHALLLNHPMDVYEEIFDRDTLEYQYGVVKNPEKYTKRESGCQSSFMPYSGFAIQEMINRLLSAYMNDYTTSEHNYRFTWYGRLSDANAKGIEIEERYVSVSDNSLEIERID